MSFRSATEGWVRGANGTLLHTNNGGSTWQPQTNSFQTTGPHSQVLSVQTCLMGYVRNVVVLVQQSSLNLPTNVYYSYYNGVGFTSGFGTGAAYGGGRLRRAWSDEFRLPPARHSGGTGNPVPSMLAQLSAWSKTCYHFISNIFVSYQMQVKLTPFFLVSSLLLASAAQAQVTFNVGPRVGLSVSTASYRAAGGTFKTHSRTGLEAGVVGNLSVGHFALQPAVLYSQKGFGLEYSYPNLSAPGTASTYGGTTTYRFNYLTIPFALAYMQHVDGQGLQLAAGPYLGLLLGGHYDYTVVVTGNSPSTSQGSGDVAAGEYNRYTPNSSGPPDTKFHSRRLDAGLQVGLGYRVGGVLVQAGYSLGLRNVGADTQYDYGAGGTETYDGPVNRNRAFQFSLAYLFGAKS